MVLDPMGGGRGSGLPRSQPRPRRLALALVGVFLLTGGWVGVGTAQEAAGNSLRRRVEALRAGVDGHAGGELLVTRHALPLFYEARAFLPAWSQAPESASELEAWIVGAGRWGLEPGDYHVAALQRLAVQPQTQAALVDRDLLLTDAFLLLASHLVSGRLHPETFDSEWIAVHREVDVVEALRQALGGAGVAGILESLQPHHPGYRRLVAALELYRSLEAAGGWDGIAEGERLEVGSQGNRVVALRARLARTEGVEISDSDLFDDVLREAVIRFQRRHGLAADGKVGPMTLRALNVSAAERGRLIELNLERWRWLPIDLGEQHVLVNLPAFHLEAVVGGRRALEMRVIVGKPYRRTPVFSDLMRYIVLNPFWEVPPSIAVQDKLPLIRKDPDYLETNGFKVLSGWGSDEQVIDPGSVDWGALDRSRFPYRLRQDPGPLNALGQVKFMFPNAFNVYLHDTPTRELFKAEDRSLSSGCIRLEHPIDLAELVLAGTPGWSRSAIEAALRAKKTVTINLAQPLPVHLQHWTAWVEETGDVAFRPDLYNRDERLDLALRERAGPSSGESR